MRNKFIVVTHAILSENSDIAGPAHNLISYLQKKNYEYLFIRHALFKEGKTLITYSGKNGTHNEIIDSKQKGEIIKRFMEGYLTIKYSNKYFTNDKPIYVGVDPLNSLWGLLLRWGKRVDKLITFSADYSERRYENSFFNRFYHIVDTLTVNNADYVWSVSRRIQELRKLSGIRKSKLFYIPNSPPFHKLKTLIKNNPDPLKIITIATISKAIDFSPVLDAVIDLRRIKDIKLTIIGGGSALGQLKKNVAERKIGPGIRFLGPKSHQEVFKIISEHGIGVALYTDEASWSFYSDSMKARDYLALGLPVIFSGDIGTGHEIQEANAGILIKRDKEDLKKALTKLIDNKKLYKTLRENALRLAEKNDIDKVLDRALKGVIV